MHLPDTRIDALCVVLGTTGEVDSIITAVSFHDIGKFSAVAAARFVRDEGSVCLIGFRYLRDGGEYRCAGRVHALIAKERIAAEVDHAGDAAPIIHHDVLRIEVSVDKYAFRRLA